MYTLPSAPRSIGGVLDDSIRLYRLSLPRVWPLTLAGAVATAVPNFMVGLQMGDLALGTLTPASSAAMLGLMKSPSYLATYAIVSLLYLMFYGALLSGMDSLAKGGVPTVGQAVAVGAARLAPFAVASLLFVLMLSIGFLLLLIPGFYLWGIFQLFAIPLIIQRAGIAESFGISRKLIRGHWWRSATLFSIAIIIVIVLSMLASVLSGALLLLWRNDPVASLILRTAVSIAVSTVVLGLPAATLLSMYYDLKLRREGSDLAARVDGLAAR